jgi:L-seryl-tRNA(Ser) seleniumtransferase
MSDPRRDLPSVSTLLETDGIRALLERHPRPIVVDAIRSAIDAARAADTSRRTEQQWVATVASAVEKTDRPSLRRVINATGIVLHTNLGRAPLAKSAVEAIERIARGFSNLEFDIETGKRGSRYSHCVSLLQQLTGAEDALVVNNCAAALVLALNALANKKEVLVSRGELVEIGGSFRIPEIMARSGAKLVEVGTTNRTHDDDYRRAITPRTAAIVKVHRSNFAIEGFTADVSLDRLAFIAAEHGLPVLHDLGSGLMLSLDDYGLRGEPTAAKSLASGASLVLMSSDKLLGGPQGGIILGSANLMAKLRRNPFARAMRVDKLTLSALEATLRLYLEPERALVEIPVLAMLTASVSTLRDRAESIRTRLSQRGIAVEVVGSSASVGGGAFPTTEIPSIALSLSVNAERADAMLRAGDPAVIGHISEGRLLLDLRSVIPDEDETLSRAILAAAS